MRNDREFYDTTGHDTIAFLSFESQKKINAKFWIKLHTCVKVFTWPFWPTSNMILFVTLVNWKPFT